VHYFTLLLVPNHVLNLEDYIEHLLAPFEIGKNPKLVPVEARCMCVFQAAMREANRQAANALGARMSDMHRKIRKKEISQESFKEFHEKWSRIYRETYKRQILHHPPQPDCPMCKGSGWYIQEIDENACWDWWVIGGRWDGLLAGKKDIPLEEAHRIENNVTPFPLLQDDILPNSIVTPDGEWKDDRFLNVLGHRETEKELWRKLIDYMKARYRDTVAVAVDLHD
jgi:hypothetical protein